MPHPRPRRLPGRFLAPNGRTSSKPLRECPSLGVHDEDRRIEVELVATHTDPRDEPEGIGPAILADWAEVNRRIFTQQHVIDVAEAQQRRPDISPQHRLADVHRRAKVAHVDMSHPIHLVQKAIDKARLRGSPVPESALNRLAGLESLLDGVELLEPAA